MNDSGGALTTEEQADLTQAMGRSHQRQEIIDAYAIVRDLMRPRPVWYWSELLLCGSAAWLAFVVAVAAPLGSVAMWLSLVAATFLFYRVSIFIHELTHRHRDELPGFHLAWNLFIGVPMLLPSVLYEGVHSEHHSKKCYGTANDPEYLPMAARPGMVVGLLLLSAVVPLHLAIRFLIDAPLSWAVPPFRRFLEKRASSFCVNPFYCRTMTNAERRHLFQWEIIVLLAWWPALAATAFGWLPWRWLPLWYGMYVAIATINHTRELVAHRYESDGQPLDHAGQLRDSLNTPGWWWTALWAPVGLRFHALHHLFPKMPYHNLAIAHRRLTQLLPADSLYRQSHNPSLARGVRRLVGKQGA